MKCAVLFYGQPRKYIDGYNDITRFIANQKNVSVDFFYHCWTLNKDELFSKSPWRPLDEEYLSYKENIEEHLKELYNPVSYEYEHQISNFDKSLYNNTLAFHQTDGPGPRRENINNTLSQLYSRNKVRNLLSNHIQLTGANYDFVIITRFDVRFQSDLQLYILDVKKVYISNARKPLHIFSDNFILSPTDIFLKWFNIYDELYTLLDNKDIDKILREYGESLNINPEELIMGKYLLEYKNLDNVIYHPSIQSGL